jgi:hypothetical protein
VTGVAAPVLRAYIHDDCFWTPCLDLQRGDERVFCVCDDVVRLSF